MTFGDKWLSKPPSSISLKVVVHHSLIRWFSQKKKFSPFSYYFYQVINLFLILYFRQLKSCPIKFYWTSSRIYRIWRYVEWQESVANGDKLLMIPNCGKMFHCVLKFQVSLKRKIPENLLSFYLFLYFCWKID